MNETDNTISGQCLPWCFTHNRNSYIMIGIIQEFVLQPYFLY